MTHLARIGFCLLALGGAAVAQTTWIVDDDAPGDPGPGDPTVSDPLEDGSAAHPFDAVQKAIDASASGDTVLVLDGVYAGVGNFELDPGGRAITMRSASGPTACAFPLAGGDFAILDDGETTATVFEGFEIYRGAGFGSVSAFVLSAGSGMTVRDCLLHTLFHAIQGAGAGELAVHDSTVRDCDDSLADGGSGIRWHSSGALTIVNCVFEANDAASFGAALYVSLGGPVYIAESRFAENVASEGGGAAYIGSPAVRVRNTVFSNNLAGRVTMGTIEGGGVVCDSQDAQFLSCRFEGNRARLGTKIPAFTSRGGGLRATGMTRLDNCLFIGNVAAFEFIHLGGHGAAVSAQNVTAVNCTFTRNARFDVAPIEVDTLTLRNCVVWENRSPNSLSPDVQFSDVKGGWPALGIGNLDADPLFVDADGPDDDPNTFDDNDYRLSSGSPCVDAAENAAVPADTLDIDGDGDSGEPLPLDLAGNPRFVDVRCVVDTGAGAAPIVDMGAYETEDFSAGTDCNANGQDDCEDISSGFSQDCNGNQIPDDCDIAAGAPDCDTDGVPDECEPDCNNNGVPDDCDIAGGAPDCDADGIPDECEPDCNGNGVPDDCDIAGGAPDCDGDGIPDECEPDCNGNGVPDECDIGSGASGDCNGNGVPDECDLSSGGASSDCNANDVPDDCDIAQGVSADCDANGEPDECTLAGALPGFALDFDADLLQVANDATLQFGAGESITLEAWIRPGDVSGVRSVVTKSRVGVQNYFLLVVDGAVAVGYRNAANDATFTYTTGAVVTPGVWRHLAVAHTFGGPAITVYVDGGPVAGAWDTAPNTGPRVANQALTIGAAVQSGLPTQQFDGLIDDVRLWRALRSQADIQSAMRTPLAGDEPGLQSYWPMDEGEGAVVGDAAGDNDGARGGADWVELHQCPCLGDLNGDGAVDLQDLAIGLSAFGVGPAGDLDGDGDTDLEDLAILLGAFGSACG